MYVQVAVNIPQVMGVYDYHLTKELEGKVIPGCLVVVPFGKQSVQGIVISLVDQTVVKETRPVIALLDSLPVINTAQMNLSHWMAEQTMSPLISCLDLMLPPGLAQHADTQYHLHAVPPQDSTHSPLQKRIIGLLQKRGDLRRRQLDVAMPHLDWRAAMNNLIRQNLITSLPVLLPPTTRPKFGRTAQLMCSPDQVETMMDNLGRGDALKRRQIIVRFILQQTAAVPVEMVYASSGGNMQDLKKLAELGIIKLAENEVWRDPLARMELTLHKPPTLTPEQKSVWDQVRIALNVSPQDNQTQPFILYGVTGSGKTEIYLRAVEEALKLKKQAIVLVPEIALTPQLVRRFTARFPGQIGLVHSRLSAGERYDTWRRGRAGLLPVIVGPRSALFTNLPDLGLIIVDEFHDESYTQTDLHPYYHVVDTAVAYARISGAIVILGSATPDITMMYRARRENWNILRLPARILAHRQAVQMQLNQMDKSVNPASGDGITTNLPLPLVKIIDMRQELKEGNVSIFSRVLYQALQKVLENNQQAILFLNRRGSATYIFCRQCGYSLRCPRCDLPLTYHSGATILVCHICDYHRQIPHKCPQCSSSHIRQYGSGTEKVENEIQKLFPDARTLRWDADTTRAKGAHDILLSHFTQHRADILIGTQMLAKGLDLPLITLVGVVLADVGLNFPDFRASERVFQLLTQVAGRAGRSPLGGQVILQSFQPEHYVIQAAARHDFDGFNVVELDYRMKLRYPPFFRLARLEYRHQNPVTAKEAALSMAEQLKAWIKSGNHSSSDLIGPAPSFFSRINGLYRWQIILRSPNPVAILRNHQLSDWKVEIDPLSLL